jgi:hypothetical protein
MYADRVSQVLTFDRLQRCPVEGEGWGDVGGRRWWKARIWSDGGKSQNILVANITCGSPDLRMCPAKAKALGKKFVIVCCLVLLTGRRGRRPSADP